MTETRISATDQGVVLIEHSEPVGTWRMTPAQAREIAKHLNDMADDAEMNSLAGRN